MAEETKKPNAQRQAEPENEKEETREKTNLPLFEIPIEQKRLEACLKELRSSIEGAPEHCRRYLLEVEVTAGKLVVQVRDINELHRQKILTEKQNAQIWKNFSFTEAIRETAKEIAHEIKQSIQNKIYDGVDKACKKAVGILDKGIEYLAVQQGKILAVSPKYQPVLTEEQKRPEEIFRKIETEGIDPKALPQQTEKETPAKEMPERQSEEQQAKPMPDMPPMMDDYMASLTQMEPEAVPEYLQEELAHLDKEASISQRQDWKQNRESKSEKSIQAQKPQHDNGAVYHAYLKDAVTKNPDVSIEKANEQVVKDMLRDKRPIKQIKECLLCAPNVKTLPNVYKQKEAAEKIIKAAQKEQKKDHGISR